MVFVIHLQENAYVIIDGIKMIVVNKNLFNAHKIVEDLVNVKMIVPAYVIKDIQLMLKDHVLLVLINYHMVNVYNLSVKMLVVFQM